MEAEAVSQDASAPLQHPTSDITRCLVALLPLWAAAPALAGPPGAVGDLYVTGFSSDNVVQFDGSTGALVGEFVPPCSAGLSNPSGLTFGPNGNLFVCSFISKTGCGPGYGVIEYDGATGAPIGELIPSGSIAASGWLLGPRSVLFCPDGRLLVAGNDNSAVLSYDGVTGEWLGTFAIGGPSPGGLFDPVDIAVGHNGNILALASDHSINHPEEWGTFRIFEYHRITGRFVRVFASDLHSPFRFAFGPNGNLFVVNYFGNDVVELDGQTGHPVGTFLSGGGLTKARGLTFGPNGNLFVTGRLDGTAGVIEYDGQSGALIGMFATGMLSNPDDLVFKPAPPDPLPAPTISGVSVSQHDACDALAGVTVTGTNLDVDATAVMLSNPNEPLGTGGLVSTYVGVVTGGSPDGTSLTVDFDLDGGARMPGGLWDVEVVNPDGQSDTLAAALDVASCWTAGEANLFVLGYRHRQTTRDGLFEFDGASGDLIDMMIEDRTIDGDDLRNSKGFVFGRDGNLLATSRKPGFGSVLKYDGCTGRKLGTFISAGSAGMLLPIKLTFGPNGNLFVLHRGDTGPSGVLEFDGLTGAFVRDFVPFGSCGLFNFACDFEFSSDGNLHITDCTNPLIGPNGGVYLFDGQTGECLAAPLIDLPPEYLELNPYVALESSPHDGNLVLPWWSWTAAPGAGLGRVNVHDPQTGALLGTPIAPPAGDIEQAHASDFDPNGHLFVAGYPDYIFEYDLLSAEVLGIFASNRPDLTYGAGASAANEIIFKPLLGDADGDWDVDLGDFAAFQRAFSGEGGTPANYNDLTFDSDRDGDVDLDDLSAFAERMSGPLDWSAPPGACCLPDGSCLENTTGRECVIELGGFWLGYGSTCAEDCPAFGACCYDDGTCQKRTAEQCASAGGDYQGDWTDCATAGCPPPGACCFPDDGSCEEWTETACLAFGGMYQGDYTECATTDCPFGRYSNEIDPMTQVALAGAGLQLADDMTLEGTGARELTYLGLRVYGNGGGDFDVTVELWTDCPGDGGTLIPGTTFTWTGIPNHGYVWTLVVDPLSPAVTIPDTVWMVATFSTPESGWIIAEDAEIGFTENRYGRDNPWNCNRKFTGGTYAGLWANLQCVEGSSRATSGDGTPPEPTLRMIRVDSEAMPAEVESAE